MKRTNFYEASERERETKKFQEPSCMRRCSQSSLLGNSPTRATLSAESPVCAPAESSLNMNVTIFDKKSIRFCTTGK